MPRYALRLLAASTVFALFLSTAPASQAFPAEQRDAPRHQVGNGFLSFLISLFLASGGAMDPNGGH
ncbi:MAG TPA: hypothetical protein VOA87_20155 [Thermoanaerobaculia bacterium]|nr:hypothetical protein [Thermoanaerobaculia bacterium]